jgi:hypothetical protein
MEGLLDVVRRVLCGLVRQENSGDGGGDSSDHIKWDLNAHDTIHQSKQSISENQQMLQVTSIARGMEGGYRRLIFLASWSDKLLSLGISNSIDLRHQFACIFLLHHYEHILRMNSHVRL